jgi:hypothetical protein
MDLSSVNTCYARTIHTDIVGLGSSGSDDTGSVATCEGRFVEWSAVRDVCRIMVGVDILE